MTKSNTLIKSVNYYLNAQYTHIAKTLAIFMLNNYDQIQNNCIL